ncbi:hypothetical protein BD311DRAFT_510283 [Dichomitus squalens]|uniref:Uncharacterized protein n=1 Tax=Dichomitus squalens TaxID=114155 RepID=A0A4V2K1H0_9APHY|nr:hypothetical protein BD311DRAFT_510283 [Dichomitus squalens]
MCMAAQAARLIGLVILVLELHLRRGSNLEFYCLCAALVVGLSFILAFTATNTGVIVFIHTLGVALCNRTIYAPTALLSSIGFIVLELYIGVRFLGWDGLRSGLRSFFRQSANLQVARAGSLLLLDVLTVAPNAVATNELAQFIPFSIGALMVLGTFNHGIEYNVVVPTGVTPTAVVLSTHSSRAPTPLSIPQPTLPPSSEAAGETPMDDTEARPKKEEEVVLESPFVPTHLHSQFPAPVPVPRSAPPRIGDASVFDSQQRRQILPFQVQYAEQLERHIHTGPIVMPIRTKPQRPRVEVIIEDMERVPERSKKSSLIGSDIVRLQSASGVSTITEKKQRSPDNVTPSDYANSQSSQFTPINRTPTTFRDSAQSAPWTPAPTRSLSAGSGAIFSAASSRQPSRRKIKSTAESSAKLPWRPAPRQSYSSAMTFGGGREELPIVVEGQAERPGSRRASRSSTTTKRMVISRPHSLRSTRPSSPQPSLLGKHLPAITSATRPASSQHLTVPDHLRGPESPSGSPIRSSSQYIVPEPILPTSPPSGSYERALGSGRLRGPRSPPTSSSTPNLRSGWPQVGMSIAGPVRMNSRHSRRRSGSCPELPPLDMGSATLRPIGPVKRDSPPES